MITPILRHRWNVLAAVVVPILGLASGPVRAASVTESARDVPIAASADVVVMGGSSAAVAAAVAAGEGGAKVFHRARLGEVHRSGRP